MARRLAVKLSRNARLIPIKKRIRYTIQLVTPINELKCAAMARGMNYSR